MLPAAPLPWVTATQAPRSPAEQAGTAAAAVSAASTVPDELAAKAALAAISPVREAVAITAAIRRAVVERCFIACRPVVAWAPLFAASFCPLRPR